LLPNIVGWSRSHVGINRAETLLARRRARRVAGRIIRGGFEIGLALVRRVSVYLESFDRFGRGGEMTQEGWLRSLAIPPEVER
jgi:hypothetical protein